MIQTSWQDPMTCTRGHGSQQTVPGSIYSPVTCRYLATPEVLSVKAHGDILREKYPNRKLPRVGYVPYLAVLALAPALGFRRDFVRCSGRHGLRHASELNAARLMLPTSGNHNLNFIWQ